ncbi:DNA primase large subunit [Babesia caballi]|uniref:DNA primase large subunit n=1 Tax=Babesia caballi TaxID=5871 RepID=A0AAV4LNN9_BABCB|nr:DNA primase large subunit [Babesia caballi]
MPTSTTSINHVPIDIKIEVVQSAMKLRQNTDEDIYITLNAVPIIRLIEVIIVPVLLCFLRTDNLRSQFMRINKQLLDVCFNVMSETTLFEKPNPIPILELIGKLARSIQLLQPAQKIQRLLQGRRKIYIVAIVRHFSSLECQTVKTTLSKPKP